MPWACEVVDIVVAVTTMVVGAHHGVIMVITGVSNSITLAIYLCI